MQVALQAAAGVVGRPQQLQPRAAQRLVGLDPLADVAQVADEQRRPLDVEPCDGQLDLHERSVGALGGHLDAAVEHVRLAAVEQALEPGAMSAPQRRRDDDLGHLAAAGVVLGDREGPLGRGVDPHDPPLVVHHHDAVERGVEDGFEIGHRPTLRLCDQGLQGGPAELVLGEEAARAAAGDQLRVVVAVVG